MKCSDISMDVVGREEKQTKKKPSCANTDQQACDLNLYHNEYDKEDM